MSVRSKEEKNMLLSKILFFSIIVSCLLVGMYLFSSVREGFNNKSTIDYIEDWTVTDSKGRSFETGRTYYDERAFSEEFTITSKLPDIIDTGSVLCFINRSNVSVYINGELRMKYDKKADADIPGGALKEFYLTIPLNDSDAGGELRMIRGVTDWNPLVVPETVVTTYSGIYDYLMGKYGVSFSMTLVLFVASLLVVAVAVVMRIMNRRTIAMMYAALSILDVACWLLCVSQIAPYITKVFMVDGTMGYIFTMMIPFGLLIYINILQKRRYQILHTILFLLSLISYVLWTVLHFSGVVSFQNSLIYIDLLLALVAVCDIITILLDIRNGHIKEYIYSAIGVLGFFVMGIVQIAMLLFLEGLFNEVPMIIGLLCLLTLIVIQQIDDIRKVKLELEAEVQSKREEKEQLLINIVQTLAGTIDAKDSYTKGHSSRVAAYATEIARRCGYDEDAQADIYIMGLLHDIGKIGVPDAIIQKTGRLTDEEFAYIKKHPVMGDKILKNIKNKSELAIGARWHHERYDGKGYPDGIKGEDIPEQARIIAVADAYDAMTSCRSYRDPLPQEKVLSEIKNGSGTQFDPRFAQIMAEMIEADKEYKMRERKT